MEVTEANVEELIQSSTPLVLDAWAPWCGPCRALTPILEDAARKRSGAVRLGKLNTDKESRLAHALQVSSIPAVFGIHQGKLVWSFVGMQSPDQVAKYFDELVQHASSDSAASGSTSHSKSDSKA